MSDPNLLELLPPELRNKIYALVLVEEDVIKIDKYENGPQNHYLGGGKRRQRRALNDVVIRGHHRRPKYRGWYYNPVTKAWEADSCKDTLALLRVDKKIHAEATAIMYGSNSFELRCWLTLERFLNKIGYGGQHLRTIILTVEGLVSCKAARRAIEALSEATNLRTLEVSHFDFCSYSPENDQDNLDALVEICAPLLQSLQASYKVKGLLAEVLDVVQVVLPKNPQCTSCRPGGYRSVCHGQGTTIWSYTSAQWKRLKAGISSPYSGREIHCECNHREADKKNQTLNEMLKTKFARTLGLELN